MNSSKKMSNTVLLDLNDILSSFDPLMMSSTSSTSAVCSRIPDLPNFKEQIPSLSRSSSNSDSLPNLLTESEGEAAMQNISPPTNFSAGVVQSKDSLVDSNDDPNIENFVSRMLSRSCTVSDANPLGMENDYDSAPVCCSFTSKDVNVCKKTPPFFEFQSQNVPVGQRLSSGITRSFTDADAGLDRLYSSVDIDTTAYRKVVTTAINDDTRNIHGCEEIVTNNISASSGCEVENLANELSSKSNEILLDQRNFFSDLNRLQAENLADDVDSYPNSSRNDDVRLAVGCHPHSANLYTPEVEEYLITKMSHPKVVAFGEFGLDNSSNNNVSRDVQELALQRQIKIATRMFETKPLVIHCRDASEKCLEIMKTFVPHTYPIHLHCFMGSYESAMKWSEYFTNLYFGVTTSICSPRTQQLDFVMQVPLNRLLIETDSPYFLPEQYRGNLQFNHPGLGELVGYKIAEFRGVEFPIVLETIYENTLSVYKTFYD